MGNFAGHAIPGSAFLLFGMWHLVQIWRKYWYKTRRRETFTPRIWQPCFSFCGRVKSFPWEPLVKIIIIGIAAALEIYTGMRGGRIVNFSNLQHFTMYMCFLLTGVVEFLIYFDAPLLPGMDYISYTMAFMVEGFLFHFHTHGRVPVELVAHKILVLVVFVSAAVVVVEMKYRNLFSALLRAGLIILQGAWFWHVSFALYGYHGNPLLDVFDSASISLTVMMFCWYAGLVLLFVLVTGAVTSCFYRGNAQSNKAVSFHKLDTADNFKADIINAMDSDSDIEYSRPAVLTAS